MSEKKNTKVGDLNQAGFIDLKGLLYCSGKRSYKHAEVIYNGGECPVCQEIRYRHWMEYKVSTAKDAVNLSFPKWIEDIEKDDQ